MLKHTFVVTIAISFLSLLACQTGVQPTDDSMPNGSTANTNDNSSTTPPADDDTTPGDDGDGSEDPTLTMAQQDAAQLAVDAVEAVAAAVAAVFPVVDVQGIVEGTSTPPACPTIDIAVEGAIIALTLDYGTGCSPNPFVGEMLGGTSSGDFFFNVNAYEIILNGLQANGTTLTGRVGGGFTVSGDVTTMAANIDVMLADGTTFSGGATVTVDETAGLMTISDATITTGGTAPATFVASIDDALASLEAGFTPMSGRLTFDLQEEGNDSATALAIEFTSDTPVSGSIQTSVNNSDSFPIVVTE